jgi:hypothetical protein
MFSEPAPDLGYLISMLLSGVKNVELAGPHDLRDTGQPMECRRIEDTITISGERSPLI